MRTQISLKQTVLSAWLVAALVSIAIVLPAGPARAEAGVKIEWLTWSFFRITSPGGKVILTNPWLKNPDSKTKLADIQKADIILLPTGHRDEVGQTVEVANKTGAKVVMTHEMAYVAFKGKIPLKQSVRVQPGSTVTVDGIGIRVVNAVHGNGKLGAAALGFFITFENGYTLYFSGSTDLTLDMKLWGELFKPDGAILYLSGGMNPRDVALMARFLTEKNPNLKTVIPHHHRLKPPAGRSPADLGKALAAQGLKATLLDPQPGKTYTLSK
jgi:L-ascorbate metabolism protein UlaG (beta-lactamase superfamily)